LPTSLLKSLNISVESVKDKLLQSSVAILCRETDTNYHKISEALRPFCGELVQFFGSDHYIPALMEKRWDFIINADYTNRGDCGMLTAMVEMLGYCVSGNSSASINYMWDKEVTKRLLTSVGLLTPDWFCLDTVDYPNYRLSVEENITLHGFLFPLIVKPVACSGSYGVSLTKNLNELFEAIKTASVFCSRVLIEQFIVGQEVTFCVLGRGEKQYILKPAEICIVNSEFVSRQVKANHVEQFRVVFDSLDEDTQAQCYIEAHKCHDVVDARCITRTDAIISNGKIYILEVNANPVLNPSSPIVKAAEIEGLSYEEILMIWIELSWRTQSKR
jgi:D-alanine-D-alanine ligase